MDRRPKQKSDWPPKDPFCVVDISVYNRQKELKINKGSVRTLVSALLQYLKISPDHITLYFVSEKEIGKIHEAFFQDPTPTDCISFPIDEAHLGELFICPSIAIQYAKKRSLNPYTETTLYIVHGLLHLLGFDDLEEKARRTMRKKEKSCMRHLDKLKIQLE